MVHYRNVDAEVIPGTVSGASHSAHIALAAIFPGALPGNYTSQTQATIYVDLTRSN